MKAWKSSRRSVNRSAASGKADQNQWVVVSDSTYLIAMMMVKISLGIFFARIVVAPWHLTLIYVTIGVNVLSSVSAFFYCIFRCGADVDNYALQQLKMQLRMSLNAIMLGMVMTESGATEAEICQRIGWKACSVTLKRACVKAGLTLSLVKVPGERSRYVARPAS